MTKKAIYDKKHQIIFETRNHINKIFFKIKGKPAFEDANMLKDFLTSYGLNIADLQGFNNEETFLERLQSIENYYNCHPGLMRSQGVEHLKAQKAKPRVIHSIVNHTSAYSQQWLREYLESQPHQTLPLLESTKDIIRASNYKHSISDELNNTLLVLTQQGFSTVIPMIKSLCDLGFKPQNIILFTKPHTTSPENHAEFIRLRDQLGFNYVDIDDCIQNTELSYAQAKEQAQNNAIQTIERLLNESNAKNVILHDEGGILANSEEFRARCITPFLERKVFTSSEHTMSGMACNQHLELPYPCFSMGKSWLKTRVESFFIAEKSFLKIKHALDNHLANHDQITLSVVGLGNIGGQFTQMLIDYAQQYQSQHPDKKFKILINDTKRENLAPFLAAATPTIEILERPLETMLEESHFVFACTGTDITTGLSTARFSVSNDVTLISLSSGDREFKTLITGLIANSEQCYEKNLGSLRIKICNEGRPIIFDGHHDAIHPAKIQLIRALTLVTIFQQLNYLAQRKLIHLSRTIENQNQLALFDNLIHDRFLDIDANFQKFLWNAFLDFQSTLPTELMTVAQENLKLKPAFLNMDASLQTIRNHNLQYRKELKVNHSKAHPANYFFTYDQNHDVHMIDVDDKLELRLVKHKQLELSDTHIDAQILQERGIQIDDFYRLDSNDQLSVLKGHHNLFSARDIHVGNIAVGQPRP
jgi:hypothetical protein